ncbi:MAG TPA: hypothetical protein VGN73_09080 [Gemmatimonadaceae bacterium]|jgi:hypothetical protein|nr:hypothetical protein [Gemmatimonadaceae bacterium]
MTVIVATVLVGTLAAGAVFVGIQEQRMGEGVRRVSKSFGIAEGGAIETLRNWNYSNNTMRLFPQDSVQTAVTASPNGTGVYQARAYRLTNQMYFIDVTGRDSNSYSGKVPDNGARDRIGMLTRIIPLQVAVKGALTLGGPVTFGGGNVFVQGADHVPPGWTTCAALDTTVAGVVARNAGDVANSQGQVTGNPNVLIDPTIDSTWFMQYGATNYDQLAAAATITLAGGAYSPLPVVLAGVCQASNMNWGDGNTPTNPCGNRFPIIHLTGDATILNGQGQGIILADGNLTFGGTFTFYGVIIVRKGFKTQAGGNPKVFGAVMAQDSNLATTAFAGDAVINYSKCALLKTKDAVSVPAQLRSRSWVELM